MGGVVGAGRAPVGALAGSHVDANAFNGAGVGQHAHAALQHVLPGGGGVVHAVAAPVLAQLAVPVAGVPLGQFARLHAVPAMGHDLADQMHAMVAHGPGQAGEALRPTENGIDLQLIAGSVVIPAGHGVRPLLVGLNSIEPQGIDATGSQVGNLTSKGIEATRVAEAAVDMPGGRCLAEDRPVDPIGVADGLIDAVGSVPTASFPAGGIVPRVAGKPHIHPLDLRALPWGQAPAGRDIRADAALTEAMHAYILGLVPLGDAEQLAGASADHMEGVLVPGDEALGGGVRLEVQPGATEIHDLVRAIGEDK